MLKMSEKMITVIFHFVSGTKIEVKFTEKNWKETLDFLRQNQFTNGSTGENFGINFSQVIYYEVKS